MRATAVLPIKRFAAAKSRLGDALDPDERRLLALAMAEDVLEALEDAERFDDVIVVTGEPAAAELAERRGLIRVDDRDDAGHSEAAAAGVRVALNSGAAAVALLPGDCPLIDAGELDRAVGAMRRGTVGVVPDRDGSGTNGLLLCPPDAIEPSFGPDSRERHLDLARRAGIEAGIVPIASLALDLDTPDDLGVLRQRVGADPSRAPFTADALLRIDRGLG